VVNVVELIHKEKIKKSFSQFAFDLLQTEKAQFSSKDTESGTVFNTIKAQPEKYIKNQSELRKQLALLRSYNKMTFVVTNFEIEFTEIIMKTTLGEDWQNFFDLVSADCRKPLFYTT
jgi:hypothetical protein